MHVTARESLEEGNVKLATPTWWAGSGSKRGGRLVRSVVPPLPARLGEAELAPLPEALLVPLLVLLPWELLRECLELGDAHSTPVAGGNSRACCGFLEVHIW